MSKGDPAEPYEILYEELEKGDRTFLTNRMFSETNDRNVRIIVWEISTWEDGDVYTYEVASRDYLGGFDKELFRKKVRVGIDRIKEEINE